MAARVAGAVAMSVVALASSCSGVDRGVDGPAALGVSGADRVEIRRVVAPGEAGPPGGPRDGSQRLPTPFGEYAYLVDAVPASEVETFVRTVAAARYIDTGGVTYDLANPEYEVVLHGGAEVLARLGYYPELGTWGEHGVPGRWIDGEWRLLALTTELPGCRT